jgi:sodium transport system permease protein
MNERIAIIFKKEVIDNLRDRRSVTSTLMYALLGPFLTLLLMMVVGNLFNEEIDKPIKVPVQGGEHAPFLVQFLEQNNVTLQPAPADPRQAVRNGDVEVVLIIPEEYGEDFRLGDPANVQLVLDGSRQSTIPTVERLSDLLQSYSAQIGSLRLLARGISPSIVSVLMVERLDVSTPQSQALLFLNMLPYLLVMTVFLGGTAVVIDTTAGERERGSLEPLLINPVRRWEFVIGKLLASLPFAIVTILISLFGVAVVFNVVPVEEFIGFRLGVDLSALGGIFLVCLPLILLASALQMIIATFARSFKEAQTYVTWLPVLPAMPGLALAFLPIKSYLWTICIPAFGQQVLILQFLRGEPVSLLNIAVSIILTLVLAGVLIYVAVRLYSREQVLFLRGEKVSKQRRA